MTQRLVLHPAADLVDAAVADSHDMERISDPAGVGEPWRQAGAERLGQIGGHHLDRRQPRRVGIGGPSAQVSGAVALDHVDHDVALEIDQPGRVDGGVVPVGGEKRRLINAELAHWPDAFGVVDERGAVLDDGVHDRPPAHPELVRQLAHGAGVLTDLAARLDPARRVSTACASTCSLVSVHVRAEHRDSRHRHRRLIHRSRVGRPKQARSRTSTAIRSCGSARPRTSDSAPTPPSTRS